MEIKKSFQPVSCLPHDCSHIRVIIFVFCIFTFVLVSSASASYISLNTTLTSKVEGDDLKVSITSTNKGNESAFNVQAELMVEEQKISAEKAAELPVSGIYKIEKTFKLTMKKQGSYPLILVIHYTDANQYPFSALICLTYEYGKISISPIFGRMKSVSLSKRGDLNLTMKNIGDTMIKAKTYLVAPGELTVEEKGKEINLPSKSEKEVSFSVKNFSALAGSAYQVFALTEFETKDGHHTIITPGTIEVVASREILGINYIIIISALIILILIFIFVQFKRR